MICIITKKCTLGKNHAKYKYTHTHLTALCLGLPR